MGMLYRERFPDVGTPQSPSRCGMCGRGRIVVVTVDAPDGPHEITACVLCRHRFIDITHHDSKVLARRERMR